MGSLPSIGSCSIYITDAPQSGPVSDAIIQPLSANVPYTPPCYCAGTLIMTARGEVAVEELVIGDAVLTRSGEMRPIRWIGRRAYTRRLVAANPSLVPVRIQAGALGGGLPRRDLLVSRRHAMFIDGVLVPASALVNGGIIAAADPDAVEYFHIELDEHDVIQAEGAWSETFIDDDSRFAFHNAAEYEALYPGHVPVEAEFCAPVIEHGPVLQAIRDRSNGVVSRTLSLQADAAPGAMMLAMLGAGSDQKLSAL